MEIELNQIGRSANDFIVTLATIGGKLSARINADMEDAGLNETSLDDDYCERESKILSALDTSKAFQLEMLINEWLSINHGIIAIEAFEEIRSDAEPKLHQASQGTCPLVLDPECEIPAYWQDYDIHRTIGGWDGHEHMGFIHREIIHKRYVSAKFPWKLLSQRKQVLGELPQLKSFENILEMGCGTGSYTSAISENFPKAQLFACDLSATLLKEAQRVANSKKLSWNLFQAPAENTGLDASSFDLITSYILMHELPTTSVKAVFKEAFRLLKPGGIVFMCDARPLWDMDKLSQWRTINRAKFGGEPFWRESTSLNLPQILGSIGFIEVQSYGLDAAKYPWVTIGVKP
jgi:SAM-dependent methyltransferase